MNKDFYHPTLQTTFGCEGNCLSACIATLFDVSIYEVPFFDDDNEKWAIELSDWMRENFGKYICLVKFNSVEQAALFGDSLVITTIISPRIDVDRHAVITQKHRIVFDPMTGEVDEPITDDQDASFLLIGDVMHRRIRDE